ncbi:MAG: hypothetical protein H6621_11175 [Halobacteriovoraceae bacterium]|nr:hypothetical protein [Halobacteriovoraceae bacterium]MCB9095620.1 hypothetical protein [Halobacteriovoraceae bacterium]
MAIRLLILFQLLFLASGYTQTKSDPTVSVTSHYARGRYDGLKFVKSMLLYRAFDGAIDHHLRELNKDPKSFREKLNKKFEESFAEKKENYLKKMGYSDKLPASEKERILSQLKVYQHSEFLKFTDLYSAIQSHSISKLWQSANDPRLRQMKAKVSLNTKKLLEVYTEFEGNDGEKVASTESGQKKFYINLKYDLIDFEWGDLGFRKEEDFYNSLVDAWIKWLGKNTKIPAQGFSFSKFDDVFTENLTDEDVVMNLYLKVKKINFDLNFKRYKVELAVDFSVVDKKDQILYEGNLQTETKEFFNVEKGNVPNLIANAAYRIPLNDFVTIPTALAQERTRKKQDQIVIKPYKNYELVRQFMTLLNTYGVEINLKSEISLLTSDNVTLNIYYQGSQERLIQIIEFIKANSLALELKTREFPLQVTL